MSSSRSSTKPASPDARLSSPVRAARKRLDAWIRRRGPVNPPLLLGYRQIYILPTRFGVMISALLFAMLLGSLNFNNNLGLFTTFLVSGIGLLSMNLAYRTLDGIRIAGCSTGRAFAGDPIALSIRLHETRDRARQGLVAEIPGAEPSPGATLQAAGSAELVARLPTEHRGWLEIPRTKLRTRHPIGWFEAWTWFWPAQRALVWPRPADNAPPLPVSGKTDNRAAAGDESDEFHGLRAWREGDPLHRIAWKASQRHQQLLARQFTRPERARVVLRLADAPARSLEQRIAIVTRWVLDAERDDDEYGLDLGARVIEPGNGRDHRVRCLDALAECE